jgi:hypothetical protein
MPDETRGRRLIAAFLLGLVLFNFPLLAVVEAAESWFGLPPLVVYLFGAWGLLILLLVLVVEGRSPR